MSCWSWGTGDCLFPLGWTCQVPPCDHDQTIRPLPTPSQPMGCTFQPRDPITFELGLSLAGQCLAGGRRSVGSEEGIPRGTGCGPLAKSLLFHWGLQEDMRGKRLSPTSKKREQEGARGGDSTHLCPCGLPLHGRCLPADGDAGLWPVPGPPPPDPQGHVLTPALPPTRSG